MKTTISKIGLFIVVLGAFFYCYEYFLRVSPSVMQPQLMQHFHLNATLFGTLSGMYFYAYTPMQLFVGVIIDRYHLRLVIMAAILACTAGIFFMASSNHFELAAFGRFLQGFGSAFAFVGMLKLASVWLPPHKFAFAAGACGALGFIGAGLSQIGVTQVLKYLPWQETLYGFAILGIVLIVLFAITLRVEPALKARARRSRVKQKPMCLKTYLGYFKRILKIKRIWLCAIVCGLLFLPMSVFAALWGIPYLEVLDRLNPTQAAVATAAIFFGLGIGSPLAGWLSDHFQHRIWIIRIGALLACLISLPVLYISNLSPSWVYICCTLFGLLLGVHMLNFVIARDLSPSHFATGTAIAFINFLTMMGGLVFQRGVGQLLDWNWSGKIVNGLPIYSMIDYQHAIIIIPVSLFLAFCVSLFIKDSLRHPLKELNT